MVITRFAPSPTGFLHIGGARTALFSWLYAKHCGGQSLLRIEDTDTSRSTLEYSKAILEGLEWLGLHYDQGPFYQTQRMHHYQEAIHALLASGKAYRCICSKERLEALRAEQTQRQEKTRYDGHCRDRHLEIHSGETSVVRFRNPTHGSVSFSDAVYGKMTVQNSELDDFIIARSDGMPTYNFTSVVDDLDMKVTHIIRGNDHVNNTFRQINLIEALGRPIPHYVHLPMLLDQDGKRLSKRHGAQNILSYREAGYLPEALLNYLVRLGWSHGNQEIFSIASMIEHFSVSNISPSPARLNEEKLLWLNQHYLSQATPDQLKAPVLHQAKQLNITITETPDIAQVIGLQQSRAKTLLQLVQQISYFYHDIDHYDQKAYHKHMSPEILEPLTLLKTRLEQLTDWEEELIHTTLTDTVEAFQLKLGQLAQPIRLAITGGTTSPPLGKTLALLGRKNTLIRLERLIRHINANHPSPRDYHATG